MGFLRGKTARFEDFAFFAVFLAYAWIGIDTRLIYHWQRPVFTTIPGFLPGFITYPGGPLDCLTALISQAYAWRSWGAVVLTAQAVALTALTEAYSKRVAGRALPLVRFVPAGVLLYQASRYQELRTLALPFLLGLGLAYFPVSPAARKCGKAVIGIVAVATMAVAYYLGGVLTVSLLGAALGAVLLAHRSAAPQPPPLKRRVAGHVPAWVWSAILLLCLGGVIAASYRRNAPLRRVVALDYYFSHEQWQEVLNTARALSGDEFNLLNRYEVNFALHQLNRLGDEMFRYPQGPPMLLELSVSAFRPYMMRLVEMCLYLGRVNEAEHFGSEALVGSPSDPRFLRLMALVYMVKGQTAAARRFLTALSYDIMEGRWALSRLRELGREPELTGDSQIQMLRRRRLQTDDMVYVWQRADLPGADMERLLLDQLDQDPSNRLAFELLMGGYLQARNLKAAAALLPRMNSITGPAYLAPDGSRRIPRHYAEAMAVFADFSGRPSSLTEMGIPGENLDRLAAYGRVVRQFPSKEVAMRAAWNGFRDTYFFYFSFGPGDYR